MDPQYPDESFLFQPRGGPPPGGPQDVPLQSMPPQAIQQQQQSLASEMIARDRYGWKMREKGFLCVFWRNFHENLLFFGNFKLEFS